MRPNETPVKKPRGIVYWLLIGWSWAPVKFLWQILNRLDERSDCAAVGPARASRASTKRSPRVGPGKLSSAGDRHACRGSARTRSRRLVCFARPTESFCRLSSAGQALRRLAPHRGTGWRSGPSPGDSRSRPSTPTHTLYRVRLDNGSDEIIMVTRHEPKSLSACSPVSRCVAGIRNAALAHLGSALGSPCAARPSQEHGGSSEH